MRKLLAESPFRWDKALIGLVTAFGVFAGLALAKAVGVGGIDVRLDLLLVGLILAELGKMVTVLGERAWQLEYLGAGLQGLAWWVWSLNLPFLGTQGALGRPLHIVGSVLIICTLPVAAHWLAKLAIDRHIKGTGTGALRRNVRPEELPLAATEDLHR